jgi:DNA-binding XRE family transcriptional regulator
MTQTLREIRQEANLTQAQLAYEADISRHAVLRMEQHVYPVPLPNVIDALSQISGLSESTLYNRYIAEVESHREESGIQWSLDTITDAIFEYDSGSHHPFIGLRHNIAHRVGKPDSAIQFSMAFSIHPFTLSEYESFRTHFPEQISIALTQANLPSNILTTLHESERFNRVN